MSERVQSASPYEATVGYCRALRVGDTIHVSGTAPIADDGSNAAPGDAGAQARRCLEVAKNALARFGAGFDHVVRTRLYMVRREDWPAIAEAHGEAFADVRPACTGVLVAGLIDPDWLVEIELEADLRSTPPQTTKQ